MSITFYPTVARDQVSRLTGTSRILLTASSYAAEEVRKHGKVRGALPVPILPEHITERAADCGGFVATFKWGDYPYTPAQYVQWLRSWCPDWAASMDFCCEDEITNGTPGVVRERQQKTTEMAWRFWTTYQENWPWVPTIQGWTIEDYQCHANELKPLISEMQHVYQGDERWRVGIGTLCRRASVAMIHDVVRAVSEVLPGVPLHLWGIKLGALQSPLAMPEQVVSVDSAAWNGLFGSDREEWKASGLPQRQWSWQVSYPRYAAKVAAALSQPKQLSLLDALEVV